MARSDTLQKHTLNLRAGDMEKLREFFPDLPASGLIRTLVSRYVDEIEGDEENANVKVNI